VALLLADVIATGGTPVTLYTFGAPRVGEVFHTRHVCRTIGEANIYRVYHDTDPVPMVPPFPYLHAPLSDQAYLLRGRGTIVSGAAHKMVNYKATVGEAGWGALPVLRQARFSFDTLDDASIGLLENAMSGPSLLSAGLMRMILLALRAVLKVAGGAVSTTLLASFTVIDAIASAMVSLASASYRLGTYVAAIMRAIMAFLGRRAIDSANLTMAYLRWVLNMLFDYISNAALRAVAGLY
jgi:hypothetical protein